MSSRRRRSKVIVIMPGAFCFKIRRYDKASVKMQMVLLPTHSHLLVRERDLKFPNASRCIHASCTYVYLRSELMMMMMMGWCNDDPCERCKRPWGFFFWTPADCWSDQQGVSCTYTSPESLSSSSSPSHLLFPTFYDDSVMGSWGCISVVYKEREIGMERRKDS